MPFVHSVHVLPRLAIAGSKTQLVRMLALCRAVRPAPQHAFCASRAFDADLRSGCFYSVDSPTIAANAISASTCDIPGNDVEEGLAKFNHPDEVKGLYDGSYDAVDTDIWLVRWRFDGPGAGVGTWVWMDDTPVGPSVLSEDLFTTSSFVPGSEDACFTLSALGAVTLGKRTLVEEDCSTAFNGVACQQQLSCVDCDDTPTPNWIVHASGGDVGCCTPLWSSSSCKDPLVTDPTCPCSVRRALEAGQSGDRELSICTDDLPDWTATTHVSVVDMFDADAADFPFDVFPGSDFNVSIVSASRGFFASEETCHPEASHYIVEPYEDPFFDNQDKVRIVRKRGALDAWHCSTVEIGVQWTVRAPTGREDTFTCSVDLSQSVGFGIDEVTSDDLSDSCPSEASNALLSDSCVGSVEAGLKPFSAAEARLACAADLSTGYWGLALADLASASGSTVAMTIMALQTSEDPGWIGAVAPHSVGADAYTWVNGRHGAATLPLASIGSKDCNPGEEDCFANDCLQLSDFGNLVGAPCVGATLTNAVCDFRKLAGACAAGWTRSPFSNKCFKALDGSPTDSVTTAASSCTSHVLSGGNTARLANFRHALEALWLRILLPGPVIGAQTLHWLGAEWDTDHYKWSSSLGGAADAVLRDDSPVWSSAPSSSECLVYGDKNYFFSTQPCSGADTALPLCVYDLDEDAHASGFTCPSGFELSPVNQRCYMLDTSAAVSFADATTFCAELNTHLATGDSVAETVWLVDRWRDELTSTDTNGIWTGWIRDSRDPSLFSRSHGALYHSHVHPSAEYPAGTSPWAAGEPGTGNCAVLGADNRGARTVDCATAMAYPLCMWDPGVERGPVARDESAALQDTKVPPGRAPALCPTGFTQSPHSGACLRVGQLDETITFEDARDLCAALHPSAELLPWAVSLEELDFISRQVMTASTVTSAWVDLNGLDYDAEGEFAWPYMKGLAEVQPEADSDGPWAAGRGGFVAEAPPFAPRYRVVVGRAGRLSARRGSSKADGAMCAMWPGCAPGELRHPVSGRCLSLHFVDETAAAPATIGDAAAACAKDGRELASPLSFVAIGGHEVENLKWIARQTRRRLTPEGFFMNRAVVAATYDPDLDDYVWPSGETVETTAWGTSSTFTSRAAIGNCTTLTSAGELEATDCNDAMEAGDAFFCVAPQPHCRLPPGTPASPTNLVLSSPFTGQCYFLDTSTSRNHADSDTFCSSTEGLHPSKLWSDSDGQWLGHMREWLLGGQGLWIGGTYTSGSGITWSATGSAPSATDRTLTALRPSTSGAMVAPDAPAAGFDVATASESRLTLCGVDGGCPAGWYKSPVSGSCLLGVGTTSNWQDAQDHCAAYDIGGHLWTPHDPREVQALWSVTDRQAEPWIGVEFAGASKGWRFLDGSDAASLERNLDLDSSQNNMVDKLRWGSLHGSCASMSCTRSLESATETAVYLRKAQDAVTSYEVLEFDVPTATRMFVCETVPACQASSVLPDGAQVFTAPGTCAYNATGLDFAEVHAWGAGGSDGKLQGQETLSEAMDMLTGESSTKLARGGAGGYASGILKVKSEGMLLLEVGGELAGWDLSMLDQGLAFTATGGRRSAVLPMGTAGSAQPVQYTDELLVASGGGGAGTSPGGAGGGFEGESGVAAFHLDGNDGWTVAHSGIGGVDPHSKTRRPLHIAGQGGVVLSEMSPDFDSCGWGTPGARNRAGVPGCGSFNPQTFGGGGGGGYFGGGAGSAASITAAGGGGGTGFVSDEVLHGSVVGGRGAVPGAPTSQYLGPSVGSPMHRRAAVVVKEVPGDELTCSPRHITVLGTGLHRVAVPPGAALAHVTAVGGGGGPTADVSSSSCVGGRGGGVEASLYVKSGQVLWVSIGAVREAFSPPATISASNPGGDFGTLTGNGTRGEGLGHPVVDVLSELEPLANVAGGSSVQVWMEDRETVTLVAGGGGGGSGGSSAQTSRNCGMGGAGGSEAGENGDAAGAVTGGGGGSTVNRAGGAGGRASSAEAGYVQVGASGGYLAAGDFESYAACSVPSTSCTLATPTGGEGYYGGGSGAGDAASLSAGGGGSSFVDPSVTQDVQHTTITGTDTTSPLFPLPAFEFVQAGHAGQAGALHIEFVCATGDPELVSVSPTTIYPPAADFAGLGAVGQVVTLSGLNFGDTSTAFTSSLESLFVGPVDCMVNGAVQWVSSTEISCTFDRISLKASAGLETQVTLTMDGITSKVPIQIGEAPVILSVTPSSAPAGAWVTIAASHLGASPPSSITGAQLGGQDCDNFQYVPDTTSLLCQVPSAGRGSGQQVQVTLEGDLTSPTSAATFTFVPALQSADPGELYLLPSGADTISVTVYGDGLPQSSTDVTELTIVGNTCASGDMTFAAGSITCTAVPRREVVEAFHQVTLEAFGHTVHLPVTVIAPQVSVLSVTPAQGVQGTALTIRADQWGPDPPTSITSVTVGGSPCTGITYDSDTQSVQCVAPATGSASLFGEVDVHVTLAGGISSASPGQFTFVPKITSVSPSTLYVGSAGQKTTFAVTGVSLGASVSDVASVKVGGVDCQTEGGTVSVSGNTVTCTDFPRDSLSAGATVSVSVGVGSVSGEGAVEVVGPPVVLSVTPTSATEGDTITLLLSHGGQNPGPVGSSSIQEITIGGVQCPSAVFYPAFLIATCRIPSVGLVGAQTVQVIMADSANSASVASVVVTVELNSVQPSVLYKAAGAGPTTSVVVYGTGLGTTPSTDLSVFTVAGYDCLSKATVTTGPNAALTCPAVPLEQIQGGASALVVVQGPGALAVTIPIGVDVTQLQILGISPTQGRAGEVLTVTPSSLGPTSTAASVTSVTVGGQACTPLAAQAVPGSIRCTIPQGAGLAPVVVTLVGGEQSSNVVNFQYAVSISAVHPSELYVSDGTAGTKQVTVQGCCFGPNPSDVAVTVAGTSCTIESVAATFDSLSCTVPATSLVSSGSAQVVVTVGGATDQQSINIVGLPTVRSVFPSTLRPGDSFSVSTSDLGLNPELAVIKLANVDLQTTFDSTTLLLSAELPSDVHFESLATVTVQAADGRLSDTPLSLQVPVEITAVQPAELFTAADASTVDVEVSGCCFGPTGQVQASTHPTIALEIAGAQCVAPATLQVTQAGLSCTGLPRASLSTNGGQVAKVVYGSRNAEVTLPVRVKGAPSVVDVSPSAAAPGESIAVTLTHLGSDPSMVTVAVNGLPCTNVQVLQDAAAVGCTMPNTMGPDAVVEVTVQGGHVAQSTVDVESTVVSVTPPVIPAVPRGSTFTFALQFSGSGLAAATSASLVTDSGDSISCTAFSATDTLIDCSVDLSNVVEAPRELVLAYPTPSGNKLWNTGIAPERLGEPQIERTAPARNVPLSPGQVLTIFGQHLQDPALYPGADSLTITLGELPCTDISVLSRQAVQCSVPPTIGKLTPITFSRASGAEASSAGPLQFAAPVVTMVQPAQLLRPAAENAVKEFHISGSGFAGTYGTTQVTLAFLSNEVTTPCQVQSFNSTDITCTADVRTFTVNFPVLQVTVFRTDSSDASVTEASTGVSVSVIETVEIAVAPAITSIVPATLASGGGTGIDIFGNDLAFSVDDISTITIGAGSCTNVEMDLNSRIISCSAPSQAEAQGGAIGSTFKVVLTLVNGETVESSDITYESPVVNVVSPDTFLQFNGNNSNPVGDRRVDITVQGSRLNSGATTATQRPMVYMDGVSCDTLQGTVVVDPDGAFITCQNADLAQLTPTTTASHGQASVRTADGIIINTDAGRFSVLGEPSLSGIDIRSGKPGVTVSLAGENFGNVQADIVAVRVGGVRSPSVTRESLRRLAVIIPHPYGEAFPASASINTTDLLGLVDLPVTLELASGFTVSAPSLVSWTYLQDPRPSTAVGEDVCIYRSSVDIGFAIVEWTFAPDAAVQAFGLAGWVVQSGGSLSTGASESFVPAAAATTTNGSASHCHAYTPTASTMALWGDRSQVATSRRLQTTTSLSFSARIELGEGAQFVTVAPVTGSSAQDLQGAAATRGAMGPPAGPLMDNCDVDEYLDTRPMLQYLQSTPEESQTAARTLEVTRQVSCKPCPEGAICEGAAFEDIVAARGFFRVPRPLGTALGTGDAGDMFLPCPSGDLSCPAPTEEELPISPVSGAARGRLLRLLENSRLVGNVSSGGLAEHDAAAVLVRAWTSEQATSASSMGLVASNIAASVEAAGGNPTSAVVSGQLRSSGITGSGCAEGYTGVLCGVCEEGYIAVGNGEAKECLECAEPGLVVGLTVTVVVLAVAMLVGMVVVSLVNSATSLRKRYHEKSVATPLVTALKLLLGHLQYLSIAANFPFQWPRELVSLFSIADFASSVGGEVISTDCLLPPSERNDALTSKFILKNVTLLLIPVIVAVFMVLLWLVVVPNIPWLDRKLSVVVASKLGSMRRVYKGTAVSRAGVRSITASPLESTQSASGHASAPVTPVVLSPRSSSGKVAFDLGGPLVEAEEGPAGAAAGTGAGTSNALAVRASGTPSMPVGAARSGTRSMPVRASPAAERSVMERAEAIQHVMELTHDGSCWGRVKHATFGCLRRTTLRVVSHPNFSRLIVAFIASGFLLHMSMVRSSLDLLTCVDVAGVSVLQGDFSVRCDDPDSRFLRVLAGIVGFLAYAVGIPAFGAVLLVGAIREVQSENYRVPIVRQVKQTLGFVYADYSHKYYMWELVVQSEKVALSFISVVFGSSGVAVQGTLGCVLAVLALSAQLLAMPYLSRTVNYLAAASLLLVVITMILGLLLVAADAEGQEGGDAITITVFMWMMNGAYFVFGLITIFYSVELVSARMLKAIDFCGCLKRYYQDVEKK